jgi:energy-coupling factor transporter ATP-binding protein EcfA2
MQWLSSEGGQQQIESWLASNQAQIVSLDEPLAGSVASLIAGDDAMRGAEVAALLQIDHLYQKRFDECSSGEKQLVRIARALSERPASLLLIEPYRHLDRFHQEHLSMLFRRLIDLGIQIAYTDRAKERGDDQTFSYVPSVHPINLEVRDVSYRHPLQGSYAIEHFSYKTENPGLTICIGTNGSGKSTLLELIAKSLKPLYGKVKLKGRPVYLPAHPEYGPFPDSKTRRIDQLNSVLMMNDSIVLLDEPTVGLSGTEHMNFIYSLIEKSKTALVLCATHDERLLAAADHILFLANGRLVFDGSSEEFKKRSMLWSSTSSQL